jgi:hypothetical protein
MAATIAAIDPKTGARGLLVEVHPERAAVDDAMLEAFCRRLFNRNVRVGLLMTPSQTVVVRDMLTAMQFARNRFEEETIDTPTLLLHARLGAPARGDRFVSQVRTWLEAIGGSWYSFLHDSAVGVMVPDVVGHLVEADLETWDGVLEAHDAAE